MKVLLKEDVIKLGSCGDEVEVKDGYGRHFLIPAGKAIKATPKNLKQFNHQKSIVQRKSKKLKGEAQAVADAIAKITLTVTKKVGDQDKVFGSVTTQELAGLMDAQGISLDKRKIQMAEPIKALGEFKLKVKLHPEVTAEINLSVVAEESQEPAESQESKKAETAETAGSTETES